MGREDGGPTPIPASEIAEAYRPVVRGYLIASAGYYAFVSVSHFSYEHGLALAVLDSLAVAAAIAGFSLWRMLRLPSANPLRLEAAALIMNALFLANVVAYQTIHLETSKLVYFILLALAYATTAPTRRLAYASVGAAIVSLAMMLRGVSPVLVNQYIYVSVAGVVTAIGMSTLMRGTVMRELGARLASEALNRQLEVELAENSRLRIEAQDLAVVAQAASRAKTEFLATISHEIRTPLNGVLGMAEVMARGPLRADQRARLATIKSSGGDLLQLVNAVLDISMIDTGRLTLATDDFSLEAFADGLAQLYGGLAREKGLAFSLTLDADAAIWRRGDVVRLRQIVSNLISNAVRFTREGSVEVRIEGDREGVVATVRDTGIGIPAERLPRIFDRFVQADGSTTRSTNGAGLGLTIAQRVAQFMGGDITVESAVGVGYCFTLRLPLPASAMQAAPRTEDAAIPLKDDALKVLIVDDNHTNQSVLRSLLSPLGVACGTADDGRAAVAAFQTEHWDVVLMDIHMPQMDGLAASRAIRAHEATSRRPRTPIIAVTASVLSHETEQYFAAGMDDVVAKPIEFARLMSALEACLSARGEAPAAIAV